MKTQKTVIKIGDTFNSGIRELKLINRKDSLALCLCQGRYELGRIWTDKDGNETYKDPVTGGTCEVNDGGNWRKMTEAEVNAHFELNAQKDKEAVERREKEAELAAERMERHRKFNNTRNEAAEEYRELREELKQIIVKSGSADEVKKNKRAQKLSEELNLLYLIAHTSNQGI